MAKTGFGVMALMAGICAASDASAYNPGAFFQSKTVIIPHDDKRHRGGEDSADSNDFLLTVSDGVGGWVFRGVNPGLYSQELTRSLVEFAEQDPSTTCYELI